MRPMTRGEVAEAADVTAETVRYYERRKLIPKPPRTTGGYRAYSGDYVERIRFIKRAQELGFTLNEIEELLALRIEADADCGEIRHRARVKIADVKEKIRDLVRIQSVLEDLAAACPGKGPTTDCPILEAMKLGGD